MKRDGTPKKRSRAPLKHKIDKVDSVSIALSDQQDIETLIRDALSGMLTDITPRGSEGVPVKDNLDAMVATCSEFMNNFIIMGYDLDGNPIQPVIHAKNQLEVDALGQYLQQYLHTIVSYMD